MVRPPVYDVVKLQKTIHGPDVDLGSPFNMRLITIIIITVNYELVFFSVDYSVFVRFLLPFTPCCP